MPYWSRTSVGITGEIEPALDREAHVVLEARAVVVALVMSVDSAALSPGSSVSR